MKLLHIHAKLMTQACFRHFAGAEKCNDDERKMHRCRAKSTVGFAWRLSLYRMFLPRRINIATPPLNTMAVQLLLNVNLKV